MTFRIILKKGRGKRVPIVFQHISVTHQIISSIAARHYESIFLWSVVTFPHHPLGSLRLGLFHFFSLKGICCHLICENMAELRRMFAVVLVGQLGINVKSSRLLIWSIIHLISFHETLKKIKNENPDQQSNWNHQPCYSKITSHRSLMLTLNLRKSSSPRLHAWMHKVAAMWLADQLLVSTSNINIYIFFNKVAGECMLCSSPTGVSACVFVCVDRCKLFSGADEAFCRKPTSLSSWKINLSDFLSTWLSLYMLHFPQQPQWHSSGPTHARTQACMHVRQHHMQIEPKQKSQI